MELLRRRAAVWPIWITATILAEAVLSEPVRRLVPLLLEPPWSVVALGLGVGAIVGGTQQLALRAARMRVRRWSAATVLGLLPVVVFAAIQISGIHGETVEQVDEAGRVVRVWSGEHVATGSRDGAVATIVDGAVAHRLPAHAVEGGSVAVGLLGAGVVVGSFDGGLFLVFLWGLGGAVLGVAQAYALRRSGYPARGWILATVVGTIVGGIVATLVLHELRPWFVSFAVPVWSSMVVVGSNAAVHSGVTGTVLWRLHHRGWVASARTGGAPR